jgi:hypothetical protein
MFGGCHMGEQFFGESSWTEEEAAPFVAYISHMVLLLN